ncbi:MAG: hypothetical protein LBM87_03565 [Ruminococcus sp.]|jgi:hypothetical protein|nr:hypothetical protein [Ruminococcus sp.]
MKKRITAFCIALSLLFLVSCNENKTEETTTTTTTATTTQTEPVTQLQAMAIITGGAEVDVLDITPPEETQETEKTEESTDELTEINRKAQETVGNLMTVATKFQISGVLPEGIAGTYRFEIGTKTDENTNFYEGMLTPETIGEAFGEGLRYYQGEDTPLYIVAVINEYAMPWEIYVTYDLNSTQVGSYPWGNDGSDIQTLDEIYEECKSGDAERFKKDENAEGEQVSFYYTTEAEYFLIDDYILAHPEVMDGDVTVGMSSKLDTEDPYMPRLLTFLETPEEITNHSLDFFFAEEADIDGLIEAGWCMPLSEFEIEGIPEDAYYIKWGENLLCVNAETDNPTLVKKILTDIISETM